MKLSGDVEKKKKKKKKRERRKRKKENAARDLAGSLTENRRYEKSSPLFRSVSKTRDKDREKAERKGQTRRKERASEHERSGYGRVKNIELSRPEAHNPRREEARSRLLRRSR